MRKTFKVHKVTKTLYLPKDVRQEGFDEELDGYMNAVTLTLIRPGTNLDLAIESLYGVIRDFELRKKAGMERTESTLEKITRNVEKLNEDINHTKDVFQEMRDALMHGKGGD